MIEYKEPTLETPYRTFSDIIVHATYSYSEENNGAPIPQKELENIYFGICGRNETTKNEFFELMSICNSCGFIREALPDKYYKYRPIKDVLWELGPEFKGYTIQLDKRIRNRQAIEIKTSDP